MEPMKLAKLIILSCVDCKSQFEAFEDSYGERHYSEPNYEVATGPNGQIIDLWIGTNRMGNLWNYTSKGLCEPCGRRRVADMHLAHGVNPITGKKTYVHFGSFYRNLRNIDEIMESVKP